MSFWELLALVSAMATILGVFLTVYGVLNNRTLKQESANTIEIIKEGFANTREILSRMEQGQEEARKEVTEVRKEVAEARKEMAEAIKYLGDLVRIEGEKTRQAIRTSS